MNIESFFNNNPPLKRYLKWGAGIVLFLWLLREILFLSMFNSIFNFVTGGIESQERTMQAMQKRADEHIDHVDDDMQKVKDIIDTGASNLHKTIEDFSKNFNDDASVVKKNLNHGESDMEQFGKMADKWMAEKIQENEAWFAQVEAAYDHPSKESAAKLKAAKRQMLLHQQKSRDELDKMYDEMTHSEKVQAAS